MIRAVLPLFVDVVMCGGSRNGKTAFLRPGADLCNTASIPRSRLMPPRERCRGIHAEICELLHVRELVERMNKPHSWVVSGKTTVCL